MHRHNPLANLFMRKIILLSFTLGLFTLSYSQVKYGVKAGITRSFIKETPTVTGADNSLQTGFQFGFFLDKTIKDNFIFRPSLQLTQKGYLSIVGNPGGPFYWNRNLSTTYLELPFDLLRKFNFNKTSSFYIGTGPVLGYALQGKLKAAFVATDNNQQLHTQISTDNEVFKNSSDRRFDFGWSFIVGIQSCRMTFNASYNNGIADGVKGDIQSLKNRCLSFSVGYLFQ